MENRLRLLIIFIKNPQKGYVKTRLARTVGDEKALEIYHKLLDHTRAICKKVAVDKQVWYSRFIPEEDAWDEGQFEKNLQAGSNLGERMKTAFAKAFDEGYDKVVIIGSDCAELSAEIINQAYQKIGNKNLVIGPSEDGGYYLLGMDRFCPKLFDGIAWSTSDVLASTLEKAAMLDLSVELLPELNDVDIEEDWKAVKENF